MMRIRIEREKCIGCLTCTTACIAAHGGGDTRTHITVDAKGSYAPIFCRHCDKPECVYTCMSGAMSKETDTHNVMYDKSRCAHCYMCIMNCPYGVLKMDEDYDFEVMKCDYCKSTEYDGPQCTANCPTGCITYVEVPDPCDM